jgi:hypothetical protein
MPVSQYADELGDAVRQTIRAYHASPYDFDRFDFSTHMGKGAGEQMYGRGGYFADAEPKTKQFLPSGEDLRPGVYRDPETQAVIDKIKELRRQYNKLFDERSVDPGPDSVLGLRGPADDETFAVLDRLDKETLSLYGKLPHKVGRTYEVDIEYPREALLRYDEPVSPDVLERLRGVFGRVKDRDERMELLALADEYPDMMKGKEVYGLLRNAFAKDAGLGVDHKMFDAVGGDRAARELFDAGVPGMDVGTGVYVMYPGTEDSIRILRKYGLLAPMAAGAMQEQQ